MLAVSPSIHRGSVLRRLLGLLRARPDARSTTRRVTSESLEQRVLLSSFYVSTQGNDANTGTLAAPFRSIQRAANFAGPGDTVFIRGGTYRETVRPAHSGSSGAPVVFRPYNNETVTVSGADVVAGW